MTTKPLLPWPSWVVLVGGIASLPFLFEAAQKEKAEAVTRQAAEAAADHDREVLCQARCGPDRVLLCERVRSREAGEPAAVTVCSTPGRNLMVWALWP